MDPRAQDVPGYHVWKPGDAGVAVYLDLEVVDRLGPEILRGFGAVPKRGVEVGGLLLGTIEPGEPAIVRVEDFVSVACDYKRGPSYLLTENDGAVFENLCSRWRADAGEDVYAVGYFRSNTRDGMSLSPEDVEIMQRYFPARENVALLVKPFATKASVAGLFVRQDGVFPSTTPQEFPFRLRELTGQDPPPRRPLTEGPPPLPPPLPEQGMEMNAAPAGYEAEAEEVYTPPASPKVASRGGWVWIPLSFIFLLLGVLLGVQSALTIAPQSPDGKGLDFSLALTVSRINDNLAVKWNREAPAIRMGGKGVLEIDDGGFTKPVDLDAAHLKAGGIVYRNSSDHVRFRLIVYLNSRLNLTETVDWRR